MLPGLFVRSQAPLSMTEAVTGAFAELVRPDVNERMKRAGL
jgi:hypothetical protein